MKVLHNSCNTVTCTLPDMSTLSPQASGVHIRQSTCACVTSITYMHSPLGTACPRASCVYISIAKHSCLCYNLYIYTYIYIYIYIIYIIYIHVYI